MIIGKTSIEFLLIRIIALQSILFYLASHVVRYNFE